jgi:hypothetical protein
MSTEDAARAVHAALKKYLDEGEIAISWCLTIDVAGPEDVRYLAHRSGGGIDGTDVPMAWTALGMLQASADMARNQLRDMTVDTKEDEEEEE